MKIFNAVIAFLLVAVLTAAAQSFFFGHSPATTSGGGGGSGPTLFSQDFETGTIPSGWQVGAGTPFYNYTPALLGSYSVAYTNGASFYSPNFGPTNTVYFYCMAKLTNVVNGTLVAFNNTNSVNQSVLTVYNGYLYVTDTGDIHDAHPTTRIPTNTLFYVWSGYTKGTGANSSHWVAWNTSNTEPSSGDATHYASMTNGNATNDVYVLGFNGSASELKILDHVAASTSDMPTGW